MTLPERQRPVAAGSAPFMDQFRIDESLQPVHWLRGGHRQSILSSSPMRRRRVGRRAAALLAASREILLDCGDGVVLQAFHARFASPPAVASKGLAVLLHGWEGSAESLYVLALATQLFEQGYDVVRLNLRDHGATHHLNRELFHSCRLTEVVGAVQALQREFPTLRLVLAGWSLGGNFMLRVAAAAPAAGLRIDHVVAISPLLDPARTMSVLERRWSIYHRYFVLKWGRSLLRKQAAWPQHYQFDALLRSRSLRRMTSDLVLQFTDFPDIDAYFAGYAITGERLAALQVRSTLIAALDDPIIPAKDLARLALTDNLQVVLARHGGHCGFLPSLGGSSWAHDIALRVLGSESMLL